MAFQHFAQGDIINPDATVYQQFYRFSEMNILSADEMHSVEDLLLNLAPKPSYVIKTPEERQYQNTTHFTGSLFPPANPSTEKIMQRLVSLTDNMCSLRLTDPNAVFRMLTYTLLSILYRDKYRHNNDNEFENTHYLLETLKCSLYSPDVEFTCLKNIDFPVDTLQMKAMGARFFAFMEDRSLRLTVNRLKCALWILQHNPMLLATFVLLFRFLLFRLEIEGTNDYKSLGSPQETIINLIEYFDLSYRSLGELFLFYEDGLFLALNERQVVAGDYFQNQSEKRSEKQQLEMKSSVKMNMIESFLVNVEQKSSQVSPKKGGMVQSDFKMINLILGSGSCDDQALQKGKEVDISTPTFNNHEELFHFGKKKKDSHKAIEEIKLEFEKLIMDNSDCSEEFHQEFQEQASTPFLGGSQNYTLASRFEVPPQKQVDSPIDQLDRAHHIDEGRVDGDRLIIKKKLTDSDPNDHASTPSTAANKTMGFSLGANEQNFFNSCPEGSTHDLDKILNCSCRGLRVKRNAISSGVVIVGFIPEKSFPKVGFEDRSGCPGGRYESDRCRQAKPVRNHKPSFLKNLKKKKESRSDLDFAKSTVTQTLRRDSSFAKDNYQQPKSNNFKKKSAIIPQNYPASPSVASKWPQQKEFDQKSSKSLNFNLQNRHRLDKANANVADPAFEPTSRACLGRQKSFEYYDSSGLSKGDLSSRFSSNYQPVQPYKFFAPVQIIAPTVYFGSAGQNSNRMVLRVNQFGGLGPTGQNPEAKVTQGISSKRSPTDALKSYASCTSKKASVNRLRDS